MRVLTTPEAEKLDWDERRLHLVKWANDQPQEQLLKEAELLIHLRKPVEADMVLQTLSTRKLRGRRMRYYEALTARFRERTGLCRCDGPYSSEIIGLDLRPTEAERQEAQWNPNSFESLRKRKDPNAHVYGGALLRLYNEWKDNESAKSFPQYFRKKATKGERKIAERHRVRYLPPEQRRYYRVSFDRQKRVHIGESVDPPHPGLYMFVLDYRQEHLMMGTKVKGRFHHTSLVGGEPVACAGMLYIGRSGRIKSVSMDSGHYTPRPRHASVLRSFLAHSSRVGSQYARDLTINPHGEPP